MEVDLEEAHEQLNNLSKAMEDKDFAQVRNIANSFIGVMESIIERTRRTR